MWLSTLAPCAIGGLIKYDLETLKDDNERFRCHPSPYPNLRPRQASVARKEINKKVQNRSCRNKTFLN